MRIHPVVEPGAGKSSVSRESAKRRARPSVRDTGVSGVVNINEIARLLDGVAIETQAAERNIRPRTLVEELPRDAVNVVPARRLVEILQAMTDWGPVSIPLSTGDGIIEFHTALPPGEVRNGFFYWNKDAPLRGRLRIDHCEGIAFVERPFLGRPSAAVLFFDRRGGIMFKVFLSRDDDYQLDHGQLTAFRALASRMGRRRSTAKSS